MYCTLDRMQGRLALASTIELILAREDVAFFSFASSRLKRENRNKGQE